MSAAIVLWAIGALAWVLVDAIREQNRIVSDVRRRSSFEASKAESAAMHEKVRAAMDRTVGGE